MDYQIVLSPELKITATEFVLVWNNTPDCQELAEAKLNKATPKNFWPIDPDMVRDGLIFLGGVGSSIAVDVLKNLIKERLTEYFKKKFPPKQGIEVKSIEQPDGSYLLVVTEKE